MSGGGGHRGKVELDHQRSCRPSEPVAACGTEALAKVRLQFDAANVAKHVELACVSSRLQFGFQHCALEVMVNENGSIQMLSRLLEMSEPSSAVSSV